MQDSPHSLQVSDVNISSPRISRRHKDRRNTQGSKGKHSTLSRSTDSRKDRRRTLSSHSRGNRRMLNSKDRRSIIIRISATL